MSLKRDGGVLTQPSKHCISVWLSIFEKCWLRTKYPKIYEKEKILANLSKKKKKRRPKKLSKQHAVRQQTPVNKKNPIVIIKAGELDVVIVQARQIPQSNITAKVATQSTYCKFYVTNNDPCYGYDKCYNTKPEKDHSPTWNKQQKLTITNTTGKLIIELWQEKYHKFGENELIGTLEIQLNHLVLHYCCNESDNDDYNDIDDWFEITLLKEKDKHKNECNIDDNVSYDYINSKPIIQQIQSVPVLDINDSETCCIHLQLKLRLESRFWSHFISHFDPVLPQIEKIDFNANLCYIEINKLYTLFDEIVIQGDTCSSILLWRKWILSVVVLFMVACFVYYPWFLFFFIQLGLLIVFSTSYAMETKFAVPKWKDKTKEFNLPSILHMICLCFGGVIAMAINKKKANKVMDNVQQTNNINEEDEFEITDMHSVNSDLQKQVTERKTVEEEDDNDDESRDMPKFTKFIVKRILEYTESTGQLWFHQEVLVWINELIIYIKEVFQWKYIIISSISVVILFILCILSVIFHNTNFVKHQCFAILATILCFYSKPVQFLLWLSIGFFYYNKNYYQRYKQYKIEQQPVFIRAKPLSTEYITKSLRANEKLKSDKKIYKYIKFMFIPFILLSDLFYGLIQFMLQKVKKKSKKEQNEIEMYDPSKLCKISIIDYNSKYLCFSPSNENLYFSHINECIDEERIFISIPITSNKIGLKWCNGNRYISAHSNGKIKIDKFKLFECEILEVIEQNNGRKIALRSHHQKYLSSDKNIFGSTQTNKLTESEKFVIELINDQDDELTMQNVLPQDQLTTRSTYLFVAKEKKKATVIREQIIRNLVNDKKFSSILAKLKSIKLLSF